MYLRTCQALACAGFQIIQITAYMDEYEMDEYEIDDTEAKAKEYCDRENSKHHDTNIHYFYNEYQVE